MNAEAVPVECHVISDDDSGLPRAARILRRRVALDVHGVTVRACGRGPAIVVEDRSDQLDAVARRLGVESMTSIMSDEVQIAVTVAVIVNARAPVPGPIGARIRDLEIPQGEPIALDIDPIDVLRARGRKNRPLAGISAEHDAAGFSGPGGGLIGGGGGGCRGGGVGSPGFVVGSVPAHAAAIEITNTVAAR